MDFRGSLISARSHALAAIGDLRAYDYSQSPDAPQNRNVLDAARREISPGATADGSDALDAARWERWVSPRQIRETGYALDLLDRAWWELGSSRGPANPSAAINAAQEAVRYLESAMNGSGWGNGWLSVA